tara:strand:- start:39849 stop:40055 length:207 start_codon:yes stop_codon:yes gene_type:complete
MTALDRLTADPHPNDRDDIGTEDGETCNRYPEPDEDAPRGYRPKPCDGVMMFENDGETVSCATCGEIA